MPKPPKADFGIEIKFEPGTESPSRVFRTMTSLIETFQEIDRNFVKAIDVKIEPVMVLEDIETGSLRTWLATILKATDDDAIKHLDWKPAVGRYLVKAKYFLIDFIEKRTTVSDRREISGLEKKILDLAEETNVKQIPRYAPIPVSDLAASVMSIHDAITYLKPGDSAKYLTEENEAAFNLDFFIAPETFEELLTKETISSEQVMILKVKKPDYLSESMWDFRHETKIIPAKISDVGWLNRFHDRTEEVRPGDALKAKVKIDVKYDFDGEVLASHYTILEVLEIITVNPPIQPHLPFPNP